MHKISLFVAVVTLALTGFTFTSSAWAYKGESMAKEAKLSLQQARKIALKTFPGQIVNEELEKEAGGSGLRYSFDIRQGKLLHEVGVDAIDGKVLENSDDSNAKD